MMDRLRLEDVYGATIEWMKVRGGGGPGLGTAPMRISHEERPLQADELH